MYQTFYTEDGHWEPDRSLKVLVVVWQHFAKGFLVSRHAESFEGGEGEGQRRLKKPQSCRHELVSCSNLVYLLLHHVGHNSMLNSSRGKAMC